MKLFLELLTISLRKGVLNLQIPLFSMMISSLDKIYIYLNSIQLYTIIINGRLWSGSRTFQRRKHFSFSQLDNSAVSLKGEGLTDIKMCVEKKCFQKVKFN